MRKISVNLPDNVYEELVQNALTNTRTLSQEVLHRIKESGIFYKDLTPRKATPKEAMNFAKEALREDKGYSNSYPNLTDPGIGETQRVEDSPKGDEAIKRSKKEKLDKLVSEGLITKGLSKADQLNWNHRKR